MGYLWGDFGLPLGSLWADLGVPLGAQRLRDPSQVVAAELAELQREQHEVDSRAETLERELRALMASGRGVPHNGPMAPQQPRDPIATAPYPHGPMMAP